MESILILSLSISKERRKQKAKDLHNFFCRKLIEKGFDAKNVFAQLSLEHKTEMGVTEASIDPMDKFADVELKRSKNVVRNRK